MMIFHRYNSNTVPKLQMWYNMIEALYSWCLLMVDHRVDPVVIGGRFGGPLGSWGSWGIPKKKRILEQFRTLNGFGRLWKFFFPIYASLTSSFSFFFPIAIAMAGLKNRAHRLATILLGFLSAQARTPTDPASPKMTWLYGCVLKIEGYHQIIQVIGPF